METTCPYWNKQTLLRQSVLIIRYCRPGDDVLHVILSYQTHHVEDPLQNIGFACHLTEDSVICFTQIESKQVNENCIHGQN